MNWVVRVPEEGGKKRHDSPTPECWRALKRREGKSKTKLGMKVTLKGKPARSVLTLTQKYASFLLLGNPGQTIAIHPIPLRTSGPGEDHHGMEQEEHDGRERSSVSPFA
jgi:hypothetical protein